MERSGLTNAEFIHFEFNIMCIPLITVPVAERYHPVSGIPH